MPEHLQLLTVYWLNSAELHFPLNNFLFIKINTCKLQVRLFANSKRLYYPHTYTNAVLTVHMIKQTVVYYKNNYC